MDIQGAINQIVNGHDLPGESMQSIMGMIMRGEATDAQIGGFLIGLRMKGESTEEIAAAARAMRELSTKVVVTGAHLVDTCGTGGDGANTFNISTTSAFVVAAAGGRVAKHGNRSVSSRSGSADVLEAAGVKLDLTPEQVAQCIEVTGIGFMFAPLHHSAMKHAIGPRRELGTRTLFNLLGPLTNPAQAPNQLLGVFDSHWMEPMAQALQALGSEHVLVVNAEDGMDEISIGAVTQVVELRQGRIGTYTLTPEQFGLARADLHAISVESVDDSLLMMQSVLDDTPGPARDVVMLNAGAAIYAAGLTDDLKTGVERAGQVIADGKAKDRLAQLVKFTQSL